MARRVQPPRKQPTITDSDGRERVQRTFDIDTPDPPKPRVAGKRIRVYNKYGARVFTTDGYLNPHSEGEILVSDLKIKAIADKVVQVK